MSEPYPSTPEPYRVAERHFLAVLSGKGGSGKTMIAACLAAIIAENSELPVLLVDADFGTAGLTYYLGVQYVDNTRVGMSTLLLEPNNISSDLDSAIRPVRKFKGLSFLSAGDPRRFEQLEKDNISDAVVLLMQELAKREYHIVVDCRGGVDADTIAVCSEVDDIILVTEPDITAYQATRNVVNVLSDSRLSNKLRGFILNKVFQNPQFVRTQGTAEFGCRPLGSIAYDLNAARAFFIGDIPDRRSTFFTQVVNSCHELYPDVIPFTPYRVWSDSDFDKVSSIDIEARRGGYVVALCLALIFGGYVIAYVAGRSLSVYDTLIPFAAAVCLGIAGTLNAFRRALGRALSVYARMFRPRENRPW